MEKATARKWITNFAIYCIEKKLKQPDATEESVIKEFDNIFRRYKGPSKDVWAIAST